MVESTTLYGRRPEKSPQRAVTRQSYFPVFCQPPRLPRPPPRARLRREEPLRSAGAGASSDFRPQAGSGRARPVCAAGASAPALRRGQAWMRCSKYREVTGAPAVTAGGHNANASRLVQPGARDKALQNGSRYSPSSPTKIEARLACKVSRMLPQDRSELPARYPRTRYPRPWKLLAGVSIQPVFVQSINRSRSLSRSRSRRRSHNRRRRRSRSQSRSRSRGRNRSSR